MNRKLSITALNEMEQDRKILFARLRSLSPEVLNIPEDVNKWSVNQVLEHLLTSEQGVAMYLSKKMQSERLPGSIVGARVRSLLLGWLMNSPIKFNAPSALKEPSNEIAFEELSNEFDASRKNWTLLLEKFPEQHLDKPIFKHPLVGRLTLEGTLKFVKNHNLGHYRQIERILSKVSTQ